MKRVSVRRPIVRVVEGTGTYTTDMLSGEEPLEISLNGRRLSVTMRTPGADFDLAAGFLVSEGVVRAPGDIRSIRYCDGSDAFRPRSDRTYNRVEVNLAPGVDIPALSLERHVFTSSSCGVCGKASIDAVRNTICWSSTDDDLRVPASVLAKLPPRLRAAQRVFDRTGGLHAAALFSPEGTLLSSGEDVGRHNAVDKVVGRALINGELPLRNRILVVSGRASFELVQKAATAGIPVLAAVSAPSSLAVEFAEEVGLTLVGFLRGNSMNVYTGQDRISFVDA